MCIRDRISIDGSTGNIYGEQVATVAATGNKNFNRFMGWADAARQLDVYKRQTLTRSLTEGGGSP